MLKSLLVITKHPALSSSFLLLGHPLETAASGTILAREGQGHLLDCIQSDADPSETFVVVFVGAADPSGTSQHIFSSCQNYPERRKKKKGCDGFYTDG